MLIDKIKQDQLTFRKEKNQVKANVLTLVIGQCNQTKDMSDENVIKQMNSLLKSIDDRINKKYSCDDYKNACMERQCLAEYLPKSVSASDMHTMFDHMVFNDIGEFMKVAKQYCVARSLGFDGRVARAYYDKRSELRDDI